jgi:hypothetical protein
MAKKKEQLPHAKSSNSWHYVPPIGYWEARRSLKNLSRFEALIKHYFNFAGDTWNQPSLEELIPNLDQLHQHDQLITEINKMIPIILSRFTRIHAPHAYGVKHRGEEMEFDILIDFFSAGDDDWQMRRDLLVRNIERSKGIFEYRLKRLRGLRWSPIYWIALVVNIPVNILVFAGVNIESEKTSIFYFWFIRILMGILLALLIIRLGISTDIVKLVTG